MKILVYSNMYPSKEIPYAGIYIKNQFDFLRKNYPEISFILKTMQRRKTNKLRSILKYIYLIFSSFSLLFKKFNIIHVHFFSLHFVFPVIYKIFHPKTSII
ncbi:MAG: hypothetical protein KAU90_01280, partial [Sulfurovaceae bacterium]|nr:hypothetical protein [Sulfurovaceae bacterium]